jgi:nitrate reductase alpha subunit
MDDQPGAHRPDESGGAVSRRSLLAAAPAAIVAVMAGQAGVPAMAAHLSMLTAIEPITNPLEAYPNRGWESVYRDLYSPDSTYHYLCAPNDTHGCLLRASVKNGVAVYADPSFGYHRATDVYGNQASNRWDPRACVSGLAYVRRAYSDRRVKGCYVRAGFQRWIDDGMPRGDDGQPPLEYRGGRGKEDFVKVSHEEAAALVAQVYVDVATTYSGEEGAARLEAQGYYEPEMIEAMHGAGTQTLKFRGGMPYNAPFRVGGFYRFANMLGLLDVAVRGVDPAESYGGRHWDSLSSVSARIARSARRVISNLTVLDYEISGPSERAALRSISNPSQSCSGKRVTSGSGVGGSTVRTWANLLGWQVGPSGHQR